MVLNMGFFSRFFDDEVADLNEEIERWERLLSPQYKEAWDQWIKRRDIVSRQMNLSDFEIATLTCREVCKYVTYSLKREIGLTSSNQEEIVRTRGNTWAFKNMKTAMDDYDKYARMAQRTVELEKFDQAIERAGNRR